MPRGGDPGHRPERGLPRGLLRRPSRRRPGTRLRVGGGGPTMRSRLRPVSAVAALAILDALRRKDLYVMAILCGLMIAAGRVFAAVGLWGLETVIKDITFGAVSLCSIMLCILLAARQVPEEISRRTLYPLLARPIGRGEMLIGKFLGTLAMSWVALLLAAAVAFISL